MPSLLVPAQVANDSCLVRVSDPGAFQFVDGGNVGSDPSYERRHEVLERFQASSGNRNSVWLPISQQMYHAWRAAVGCPAATIQSMTPTQIIEALTVRFLSFARHILCLAIHRSRRAPAGCNCSTGNCDQPRGGPIRWLENVFSTHIVSVT